MEKNSDKHVICLKCSKLAVPGKELCYSCLKLEKKASEDIVTLREAIDKTADKIAERMKVHVG